MSTCSNLVREWRPLLAALRNENDRRGDWEIQLADGMRMLAVRIDGGMNNRLFRLTLPDGAYAVKFYVPDARQRARREWVALRALQDAHLALAPAPVAYFPPDLESGPAVIYRWIEGQPLDRTSAPLSCLARLMELTSRIHKTPVPHGEEPLVAFHQPATYAEYVAEMRCFAGQIEEWAERCDPAAMSLSALVVELRGLLPAVRGALRAAETISDAAKTGNAYPIPALLRVDNNLSNVLRDTNDALWFIDWEYSGWGDPAFDLAEMRWHPSVCRVDPGIWAEALEVYEPHPADASFHERWRIYDRLLPCWWVIRTALHLFEGTGQIIGRARLTHLPASFYAEAQDNLRFYLAAAGIENLART